MPITKTVMLYEFDELSEAAKEQARDWWRECEAQEFGGFGEIYEPAETAAAILGIEFKQHDVPLLSGKTRSEPCIWWSLHTQGSGACFEGSYSYKAGAAKALRAEFPTATELHEIADRLESVQRPAFYRLSARVEKLPGGHHYTHEHTVGVDVSHPDREPTESEEKEIEAALKCFMRWIHAGIESEYEYRMSAENVDDAIEANEYTFTAEGEREN